AGEMDALAPNPGSMFGSRNWNSGDQIKAAFAGVGVAIESTGDDVLAGLTHPLAGLLRNFRAAAKRASTYGRTWLGKHAPGAPGTVPARLISPTPRPQTPPRGRGTRRCFTAPPGRVLVKADYSQLELRIAAKVADEKVMIAAYQGGQDLHRLTAARVLGKPEGE